MRPKQDIILFTEIEKYFLSKDTLSSNLFPSIKDDLVKLSVAKTLLIFNKRTINNL